MARKDALCAGCLAGNAENQKNDLPHKCGGKSRMPVNIQILLPGIYCYPSGAATSRHQGRYIQGHLIQGLLSVPANDAILLRDDVLEKNGSKMRRAFRTAFISLSKSDSYGRRALVNFIRR
jgi:hypothetical protein